MSNVLPSKYQFIPANKSVLVKPIDDDVFNEMLLSEDDKTGKEEEKNKIGSLYMPDDIKAQDAQVRSVNYVKGEVISICDEEIDVDIRIGDIVVYNIRAVMKVDALKDPVIERVAVSDVLAILRKK